MCTDSAAQGTGRPVNMEEEFRLLTLQVIGEAILGLHHDECDQVWGLCGCTVTMCGWQHATHGICVIAAGSWQRSAARTSM